MMSMITSATDCTYAIVWSDEDQSYVATVEEFPSLSWLDDDKDAALAGIHGLTSNVIADLGSAHETNR